MRQSQAAIVLFRDAENRYLLQWSESWHALHIVGGHRERDESFLACARREIEEELRLEHDQFALQSEPIVRLEYTDFSESARAETNYVMEVFAGELPPEALPLVAANPANRWVARQEIDARQTFDGVPISRTVSSILGRIESGRESL